MARPGYYELTEKFIADICAFIRSGGFPHVAAEAAGIPVGVFHEWLLQGEKRVRANGNPLCHKLRNDVRTAVAPARLTAEVAVFSDNPAKWLQTGPGKEQPNNPGWSVPVKPIIKETTNNLNLLLSPQLQGMFAVILQLLEPYLEARAKIA
jgi:hypothetical protein